ncbi:MAG: hypothetical protein M1608_11695 [Candidatus Omnitrophica bacterium]|nr:hypothetical protein [Candidatus Omnitrophota bacterium]
MGWLLPPVWERIETFSPGPDYRVPYELSSDYWLYARRLSQVRDPARIIVLGDSVVWGEYVLPDGTLSHFLNQEAGQTNSYINGGINGLFPLAMEGLIKYYGGALRQRRVLLFWNALWLTSPKADLQEAKEETFNHARLVPQFMPRIPCYGADMAERLSIVIEREIPFLGWVNHLQNAYFDQRSILNWTLADDGNDPPNYPHCYQNPLAQITLRLPMMSQDDSRRGPKSPRHKPWSETTSGNARFEWVALDTSLQWAAFKRSIEILRQREDNVLVVLGPFNEHLLAAEDKLVYRKLRDGAEQWLAQNQVRHLVPRTLSSELYADASHPLTQGYARLAGELYAEPSFRDWLRLGANSGSKPGRARSLVRQNLLQADQSTSLQVSRTSQKSLQTSP